MTDLFLDRNTHDLAIINGDLQLVDGIDLLRQRLKQRLLTIQGEWFLDQSIGLPYFTELSQKNVTLNRVRSLYLAAIRNTDDVTKVTDLQIDLDSKKRELVVNFTVETTFGQVEITLP